MLSLTLSSWLSFLAFVPSVFSSVVCSRDAESARFLLKRHVDAVDEELDDATGAEEAFASDIDRVMERNMANDVDKGQRLTCKRCQKATQKKIIVFS